MFKRFVPKEYRSLLDYISPAAFRVIDWKQAVGQFIQVSKNALDSDLVGEIKKTTRKLVSTDVELGNLSPKNRWEGGGKEFASALILDVYFSQFFSDTGCFLDLRLKHFSTDNHKLQWKPGAFIHSFDKGFRTGMLAIYEGYYFQDTDRMQRGLLAVGLIKDSDAAKTEEVTELLFSHFGDASSNAVTFDLEQFKDSFHSLFVYLKRSEIRLSADFLFLGMYLVTLYQSLSELAEPVDVKACFDRVWQRNSDLL